MSVIPTILLWCSKCRSLLNCWINKKDCFYQSTNNYLWIDKLSFLANIPDIWSQLLHLSSYANSASWSSLPWWLKDPLNRFPPNPSHFSVLSIPSKFYPVRFLPIIVDFILSIISHSKSTSFLLSHFIKSHFFFFWHGAFFQAIHPAYEKTTIDHPAAAVAGGQRQVAYCKCLSREGLAYIS